MGEMTFEKRRGSVVVHPLGMVGDYALHTSGVGPRSVTLLGSTNDRFLILEDPYHL